MQADHTSMTDRDFCYWLEGYIDKAHSYWAKAEHLKKADRKTVDHLTDEQGKELYRRVESARRNRRGNYDKYTIFVEWIAGMLEMWGHLKTEARRVANDSINRELCDVLKSYDPQALLATAGITLFTCSSIDNFDKFNDVDYTNQIFAEGTIK